MRVKEKEKERRGGRRNVGLGLKGRVFGRDGREKKEKGGDGGEGGCIDCSQAEGAVCGAWRWALRTPGLSLLSGPEEKQNTH